MISASAVTKRYPEGLEALHDVSFELRALAVGRLGAVRDRRQPE